MTDKKPPYPLTPAQEKSLRADLRYGYSLDFLAKKYGFAAHERGNGFASVMVKLSAQVGLPWADHPWADQLRAWLDEGVSKKEIARRTHLQVQAINRRIKTLGLASRPGVDPHFNAATLAALRADWEAGVPLEDLAEKYQRGADKLLYLRRRHGWPIRDGDFDKRPYSEAEDAEIRRLYAAGASGAEIAKSAILAHRSQESVEQRIGRLKLTRAVKAGRAVPETVAPRIVAYLKEHGATPVFRLRDHTGVRDPSVLYAALRRLKRAGEAVDVSRGVWDVVR